MSRPTSRRASGSIRQGRCRNRASGRSCSTHASQRGTPAPTRDPRFARGASGRAGGRNTPLEIIRGGKTLRRGAAASSALPEHGKIHDEDHTSGEFWTCKLLPSRFYLLFLWKTPLPPISPDLRILAIDVGGTGLKAAVLDAEGNLVSDRVRVKTPYPCKPETCCSARCSTLVEPLAAMHYNRISIGFPGVVRRGAILTAPKLGTEDLHGYPLAQELIQAPRPRGPAHQRRRHAGTRRREGAWHRDGRHARHGFRLGHLQRGATRAAPGAFGRAVPQGRDVQRPTRRRRAQKNRSRKMEPPGAARPSANMRSA